VKWDCGLRCDCDSGGWWIGWIVSILGRLREILIDRLTQAKEANKETERESEGILKNEGVVHI
jgi:hypothetical protein